MTFYELDFTYKIEEYGSVMLEAEDREEAEQLGIDYVKESFPSVMNITIDEIKEIVR